MKLYIAGKHKALVVKIVGDLDDHEAENIREIIDNELQKTGAINLVFDLSRTSFMDSSGLGMIMGRYRTVKALGGKIAVAGASETVERIIKMSRVSDLVIMTQTLEEGLEEVSDDAAK